MPSDLQARIERLRQQLRRHYSQIQSLEDEIERFSNMPDLSYLSNGSVIRFDKRFSTSGTIYSYAAIKAGELWYSTGPKAPKGYTNDEMMAFIADGGSNLELATMYNDL